MAFKKGDAQVASQQQFLFPVRFARRVPDPVFGDSHGIDRHIFFVPVRSVPKDLPLDPNARVPSDIRKRVYKEIERSLLDDDESQPGSFHLKHKGITVVAQRVSRKSEDEYLVAIGEGYGILDGGHTYELIIRHLDDDSLPANQFVKFEVLTNIPSDWITDIAGGLNTSVQVQPMSLDALAGKFDWIKDEIKDEPYFEDIAWREGEDGLLDARDIVGILTCFNIGIFPNGGSDQIPVVAYERKAAALQLFEDRPETYRRLRPILKDMLVLHDTIRRDAREIWNTEEHGKAGNLSFVEKKGRGDFLFPFTRQRSPYRLMNGALYPMLGALRWMVEDDPSTGNVRWRGGFPRVLELWRACAVELMRMTVQANTELGRSPNALGKSRNHWANLHARVAMRDLMAQTGVSA